MADQIDLGPLETLIRKSEEVHAHLVKVDKSLEAFAKKKVNFQFTDNFRQGVRSLDELSRAFDRFEKATDTSIKISVENIGEFIKEITELDLAMDDSKIASRNLLALAESLNILLRHSDNRKTSGFKKVGEDLVAFSRTFSESTNSLRSGKRVTEISESIRQVALAIKNVASLPVDSSGSAIKGISSMAKEMVEVIKILDGMPDSKDHSEAFTFLRPLVTSLGTLSKISDGRESGSLNKIGKDLVEFVRNVTESTNALRSGKRVTEVGEAIRSITLSIRAIATIPREDAKASAKDISETIKTLVETFKVLDSTSNMEEVGKVFVHFRHLANSLKALGDPSLDGDRVLKMLSDLVDPIGKLSKDLKEVDGNVFRSIVGPLRSFIVTITTIDAGKLPSIGVNLETFFRSFKRIFTAGTVAFNLTDAGSLVARLRKILLDLSTVFEVANRASFKETKFSEVALSITKIVAVFQAISKLSSVLPGSDTLDKFSTTFKKLGEGLKNMVVLKELTKLSLEDLGKITGVLTGMITFFQLLSKVLTYVPGSDSFEALAKTLDIFGRALRTLKTVSMGVDPAMFHTITQFAVEMGKLVFSLRKVAEQNANLTMAKNLSTVIRSLSNTMSAINSMTSTGTFNKNGIKDLTNYFMSLTGVFQAISLISNKLPGSKELDAFSTVFKRLGSGIAGISEIGNMSGLSGKDFSKVVSMVASLSIVMNLLSKLLSIMPGAKSFGQFVTTFEGLANAISIFHKITKESASMGGHKLYDGVSVYIKIFQELSKGMGNMKDVDFHSMGPAFKSLFDGFSILTRLPPINSGDMHKSFKNLVRGLNEFRHLRIDRRMLADMEKSLGPIAKILELQAKSAKSGVGLGEGIGKSITDGLSKAMSPSRITRAVVPGANALASALNPFKLIMAFRDLEFQVYRTALAFGSAMSDMGSKVINLGREIKDFGMELMSNFGLSALLQSEGVALASEFDTLSKQLVVFGDLTQEELKRAQDFSNQIGIDYPLSSNEALAATLSLIKAGQQLSDVEFILPSAADLSALSDSGSIESATNTLIAAQAQFTEFSRGIKGTFQNSAIAADILAAGADLSTASVESLSEGLANVGPIASQYNLTMQDTVAILSILEDGAVRGAEAGTALRSALTNLNTATARNELRRLGVELSDKKTGRFRDFNEIFLEIQETLDGKTQAQQVQSLKNLFGAYGQTGAAILMSAGGFGEFREAMESIAPASERAQMLMDTFAGDVEQLSGVIETLMTKAFLPLLNRVFRPFVVLGTKVGEIFLSLPEPVLETIMMMVTLATTFVTIAGAAAVAIGGLLQVSGAVMAVGGAIFSVFVEGAALVAGIAGVVTGFISLVAIGTAVVAVLGSISAVIVTIFNIIESDAGRAGYWLEQMGIAFNELLDVVWEIVGVIADIGKTLLSGLFSSNMEEQGLALANIFFRVRLALKDFKQQAEEFLSFVQIIQSFLGLTDEVSRADRVYDRFTDSLGFQDGDLDNLYEGSEVLRRFQRQVEDFLKTGVGRSLFGDDGTFEDVEWVLTTVQSYIQSFVKHVKGLVGGLFNLLFGDREQALLDVKMSVSGLIATLLSVIGNALLPLGSEVRDAFFNAVTHFEAGDMAQGFGTLVSHLGEVIKNALITNRNAIGDLIQEAIATIFPGGFFAFIFSTLGMTVPADIVYAPARAIAGVLRNIMDTVIDILSGVSLEEAVFGRLGESAGTAVQAIKEIVKSVKLLFEGISEVVASLFGGSGQPSDASGNFLTQAFESVVDIFSDVDKNVLKPLSEFLTQGFRDIIRIFSELNSNVLQPLKGEADGIAKSILSGVRSARRVLDRLIGQISRAIEPMSRFFTFLTNGGDFDGTHFLNAAGESITNLFGVIGKYAQGGIKNIRKILGEGLVSDLLGFLQVGDLSGFVSKIGETIGNAFGQLPWIIGRYLIDTGLDIGDEFLVNLGNQLMERQYDTAINMIGEALGNLIRNAAEYLYANFLTLVGNVGAWVTENILGLTEDSATTGSHDDVLQRIGEALSVLIGRAILLIPEGLKKLGMSIGNPILEAIADDLFEGDFSSAMARITTGISELIAGVGDSLSELLKEGMNSPLFGFISSVVTSLKTLLTLPFDLFREVLDFIDNLAASLAGEDGDKDQVKQTAWIAVLVGLLGWFTVNTGLLTAAGVALRIFMGALKGLLIPFIKILAILVVAKNAISALNTLITTGDLGQALKEFFTGVVADIMNFLGMDISQQELLDGLEYILRRIEGIFYDIAYRIQTGVQNIFDGMVNKAIAAIAQVAILGGLAQEGFQVDFWKIREALEQEEAGDIDGKEMYSRIAAVLASPANLGLVQTQLRGSWREIWDSFIEQDLAKIAEESPADLGAIFATVLGAGAFNEAAIQVVKDYGADTLIEGLKQAAEVAPELVSGLDFRAVMNEFTLRSASGEFTPEESIEAMVALRQLRPDISDKEMIDFATRLYGTVEEGLENLEGISVGMGIQPPVHITPTPIIDLSLFNSQIEEEMGGSAGFWSHTPPMQAVDPKSQGGGGSPAERNEKRMASVTIPVNVTPVPQETMESFAKVSETFTPIKETVNGATETFETFSGVAKQGTDRVVGSLNNVKNSVTQLAGSSVTGFAQSQNAVMMWATVMINQFNNVITAVHRLNGALFTAVDRIAAIEGSAMASGIVYEQNMSMGVSGKRAKGGPVSAGALYEILERGQSEILSEGGRHYLLAAQPGMVTPLPLSDRGGDGYLPSPSRGPAYSGGSGNSVVVNEGAINITINGGTSANPDLLVRQARDMIRTELDKRNESLRSRLRTGHR